MDRPETNLSSEGERRAAPRHIANLKAPVLISAFGLSAGGEEQSHFLQGRTADVSTTGVALIISSEDHRDLADLGSGWVMHLLLPLPKEAIEVEVTPVRSEPFASPDADEVLIGAHITKMGKRESSLFLEFIQGCEAAKKSEPIRERV